MPLVDPDELTDDGLHYMYRDGSWTTPTGYRVSTAHNQSLTMKFYERNGRPPTQPLLATAKSVTKAGTARTAALRAAVERARARKRAASASNR